MSDNTLGGLVTLGFFVSLGLFIWWCRRHNERVRNGPSYYRVLRNSDGRYQLQYRHAHAWIFRTWFNLGAATDEQTARDNYEYHVRKNRNWTPPPPPPEPEVIMSSEPHGGRLSVSTNPQGGELELPR